MRDTAVYSFGNAIAAVLPLAVLPILTRNVSTEEFGLYANLLAFAGVLFPFANLGLSNILARDYVHRGDLDYAAVVSTCMLISASCLALVAFGLVALVYIHPGVLSSVLGRVSIVLVVATLPIIACQTVLPTVLAIYAMERRPFIYIAVRVVHAAIFAALSVIVVVGWAPTGQALIHAKAVVDLLVLAFCVVWLARSGLLVPRVSRNEGRRCLAYGLPLVPHMIAAATIGAADRLVVTHLIGASAAGVYSVGYQIGMVMWLIVSSAVQAWQPWFYQQMKEGTALARRKVVHATYAVAVGWLVLAALLWLASPWIVGVAVAGAFHDASRVTPWIIAAFLFQGLYSLASGYLYFSGHTSRITISTLVTSVVHLLVTYSLTMRNGIDGAAQATAIAYLALFLLTWGFAQSTTPMPWIGALRSTPGRI